MLAGRTHGNPRQDDASQLLTATHGGHRHDRNQQRGGAAALPEADANRQPSRLIPIETGSALIATSSNQTRASVFLCAPNDTHNCLLRAYVKATSAVRISPTYGYGKAQDLIRQHRLAPLGSTALPEGSGAGPPHLWRSPRQVADDSARLQDWVDAGFPRDPATGKPDAKYFQRGKDRWSAHPGKTPTAIRHGPWITSLAPTPASKATSSSAPRATIQR